MFVFVGNACDRHFKSKCWHQIFAQSQKVPGHHREKSYVQMMYREQAARTPQQMLWGKKTNSFLSDLGERTNFLLLVKYVAAFTVVSFRRRNMNVVSPTWLWFDCIISELLQFSTYFPGYFDGQYWLWWVFLALGEWETLFYVESNPIVMPQQCLLK